MSVKTTNRLNDFRKLYDTYSVSLLMYASKFVGDEQAKDCIQDVFTTIWARDYIDFNSPAIKQYLYSSVRNKCLDYIRFCNQNLTFNKLNDFQILMLKDSCGEDFLEKYQSKDLLGLVYREIDQLSDITKLYVKSYFIDGLSQKEIANKYGVSLRTVEVLIYRGMKRIREKLIEVK